MRQAAAAKPDVRGVDLRLGFPKPGGRGHGVLRNPVIRAASQHKRT
jgi:hypothetical protein